MLSVTWKTLTQVLRSHRKAAKTEFYQLIVVVHFNRVISYQQLIENLLIVNIPRGGDMIIIPHRKRLIDPRNVRTLVMCVQKIFI